MAAAAESRPSSPALVIIGGGAPLSAIAEGIEHFPAAAATPAYPASNPGLLSPPPAGDAGSPDALRVQQQLAAATAADDPLSDLPPSYMSPAGVQHRRGAQSLPPQTPATASDAQLRAALGQMEQRATAAEDRIQELQALLAAQHAGMGVRVVSPLSRVQAPSLPSPNETAPDEGDAPTSPSSASSSDAIYPNSNGSPDGDTPGTPPGGASTAPLKKLAPFEERVGSELKGIRIEKLKDQIKIVEYAFSWTHIISGESYPNLRSGSDWLRTCRHCIQIIELPEAVLKLVATVRKWFVGGPKQKGLAICETIEKTSEVGNKVCDGIAALSSKPAGLFRLSEAVSKVFAKVNICFLGVASLAHIALRANEIDISRKVIEPIEFSKALEINESAVRVSPAQKDQKEAALRIIHATLAIFQWISYVALSGLILYALFANVWLPNWAPLACSTSALVFSLSAYFFEKYSGLKELKERKSVAFEEGIWEKVKPQPDVPATEGAASA